MATKQQQPPQQKKPNPIVLVGSEKGGVGKTTVAFNLAVMRARAGKNVLLVDTDKQGSSAMWASLRSEADFSPPLLCVQKFGKIGIDLIQLRDHYEIIVDAGGQDSVELRQAIAVADLWVIPVRPSQIDLLTIAKMRQLKIDVMNRVERAPDVRVLLNAVSPSTKEHEEARKLLSDDNADEEQGGPGDMPVMRSLMIDRVSVRRAIRINCAVVELPAKEGPGPAVTEMMNVYEEIYGEAYVDTAATAAA
jgi:chromosome partitioning protein